MSLTIHESEAGTRLVLFSFPYRRLAVGVGLVVGLLIPWLYEFTQRPASRQSHGELVTLALVAALATLSVLRVARYEIRLPGGELRWWALSIRGLRRGSSVLDGETAGATAGAALHRADERALASVTLPGQPASIALPLPRNQRAQQRILDRLTNFLGHRQESIVAATASSQATTRAPRQRSILWIFGLVSVSAVLIAAARFASPEMILLGVGAVVLAIWVRSFWLPVDQRSRVQATLAAIYLPFVWVIAYNKPFGHSSGMLEFIPIAPSIVTSMLFSWGNPQVHLSVVPLVLAAEIGVATWIARRSATGAVVTLLVMLALSTLGSFVLHALYRF